MSRYLRRSVMALAACALAQAEAQTQVQFYGRLNVSAEYMKASASADGPRLSQQRLSNNRSVLGFRGSEVLGNGVSAIFQVEAALAPDTGAGELARRDTRVGLDGDFGTLFAGHWTAAYNGATSSLDPFYPTTAGYTSIIGNGSAASTDNVGNTSSFDRRQANSIHYWSRPWNGLGLRLTHGLAEERPASGAKPSMTSVAAVYEQGPWYAALAHERHHEYQGPGLSDSGARLAVARRFGDTRVALLAERLEYETAAGRLDRNAWYVSVTHQLGAHGLRLALARAGDGDGADGNRVGFIRGGARTGATHLTLGYEYTLSKRTALHAYVTHLDNEANGAYDFGINGLGAAPGATLKGAALGLRHAF
ncbi:putative porin [Massilia sp. UYP11]|uniref:porin n=1 Tax=Massilia sp. UYP11 TaxID=1756385 RepID=UPI003D21CF87